MKYLLMIYKFQYKKTCRKIKKELETYEDLLEAAKNLFGAEVESLNFMYKDEDQELVNIYDEDDFECCLDEAQENKLPSIKFFLFDKEEMNLLRENIFESLESQDSTLNLKPEDFKQAEKFGSPEVSQFLEDVQVEKQKIIEEAKESLILLEQERVQVIQEMVTKKPVQEEKVDQKAEVAEKIEKEATKNVEAEATIEEEVKKTPVDVEKGITNNEETQAKEEAAVNHQEEIVKNEERAQTINENQKKINELTKNSDIDLKEISVIPHTTQNDSNTPNLTSSRGGPFKCRFKVMNTKLKCLIENFTKDYPELTRNPDLINRIAEESVLDINKIIEINIKNLIKEKPELAAKGLKKHQNIKRRQNLVQKTANNLFGKNKKKNKSKSKNSKVDKTNLEKRAQIKFEKKLKKLSLNFPSTHKNLLESFINQHKDLNANQLVKKMKNEGIKMDLPINGLGNNFSEFC